MNKKIDAKNAVKKKLSIFIAVLLVMATGFALSACEDYHEEMQDVKLAFVKEEIHYGEDDYMLSSANLYVIVQAKIEAEDYNGNDKYEEVLEMLNADEYKKYVTGNQKLLTMYRDDLDIESASFNNGTVTVDFDPENLNGSALEESALIGQMVLTLTNTFPEVKYVQFTVNGQAVDSLMGHIDTAEPFTADQFENVEQ